MNPDLTTFPSSLRILRTNTTSSYVSVLPPRQGPIIRENSVVIHGNIFIPRKVLTRGDERSHQGIIIHISLRGNPLRTCSQIPNTFAKHFGNVLQKQEQAVLLWASSWKEFLRREPKNRWTGVALSFRRKARIMSRNHRPLLEVSSDTRMEFSVSD